MQSCGTVYAAAAFGSCAKTGCYARTYTAVMPCVADLAIVALCGPYEMCQQQHLPPALLLLLHGKCMINCQWVRKAQLTSA